MFDHHLGEYVLELFRNIFSSKSKFSIIFYNDVFLTSCLNLWIRSSIRTRICLGDFLNIFYDGIHDDGTPPFEEACSYTLLETNIFAPGHRPKRPKRKLDRLPTIHYQVLLLLVSGRVRDFQAHWLKNMQNPRFPHHQATQPTKPVAAAKEYRRARACLAMRRASQYSRLDPWGYLASTSPTPDASGKMKV